MASQELLCTKNPTADVHQDTPAGTALQDDAAEDSFKRDKHIGLMSTRFAKPALQSNNASLELLYISANLVSGQLTQNLMLTGTTDEPTT